MACSTTLLALTITLAAASVCASLGLQPTPLWLTVAFSGAAAAGRQTLLLCAAFDRAPAQYCAEERVVRAARQTGPTTVTTATAAAGALALAAVLAPRELRALRELCIFAGCVTVLLGIGGSFFGYAALLVSARAGERALAKAAKAANTAVTAATAATGSATGSATNSTNNGTKKGWCGFSKLRSAKPPVCVTVNSSPVGSPRSPQHSVTSPLMFRRSPSAAATATSSAGAASASVAADCDGDSSDTAVVAAHSRPWSLSTPVLSSGSSSVHATDASTAAAATTTAVRFDSSHSSSAIKLSIKPPSPGVTPPSTQPLQGRIAAVITGRWYLRLPLLLVMLAVAAAAAWTVVTSPHFPAASRTTLLSTQIPLAGYLANARALGLLQGESFERATLYISTATAADTSFLSSAAAQAEVQRLEAALWGLSPAQPPADSWLKLFSAWCSAGAVSCTGDGFAPALHNFLGDSSATGGARFVYNFVNTNSSSSAAVAATRVTWWHGKRSADTVAAARAVAASSTTLSAVVDAPSWSEVDIAHMATLQVNRSSTSNALRARSLCFYHSTDGHIIQRFTLKGNSCSAVMSDHLLRVLPLCGCVIVDVVLCVHN
jgi:hypothetical protein